MREEWKEDSEGKKGLDRERFDWCWFELADMWTSSMEAEEYAEFLHTVLRLMTTTKSVRREDGTIRQQVVWRDDREVMPNPNPNPNPNPKPKPKPNPNPKPNDREVMRAHYEHRRQQGHTFSELDNYPRALATWANYLGMRSVHPSRAGTPHGATPAHEP